MPVKTTDDFVKAPVGTAAVQACACCKMDMPVVLLKSRGARPDNVRYDGPSRVAIEGQYCEFCEFVALYKSSEKYNGRVAAGKIVRGEGRELVAFVPFLETTRETWDRTLTINLTGAFLCAKRALPGMREQQYGRVIAIGSSAGKSGGTKSVAAYAASKAGVMALAKSIANEFAREGITANALAPTLIDTPMIDGARELMDTIPVGRFGKPEEVAALVCFLASEHAAYITGEVTDINGGYLID